VHVRRFARREFEQPAEMVLLCSYVLNNVR